MKMKKLFDVNFNEILSKRFEELTEEEKMLLALKGALKKVKENKEDPLMASFIVVIYNELKDLGWTW